jgi:hypothetical protein
LGKIIPSRIGMIGTIFSIANLSVLALYHTSC